MVKIPCVDWEIFMRSLFRDLMVSEFICETKNLLLHTFLVINVMLIYKCERFELANKRDREY